MSYRDGPNTLPTQATAHCIAHHASLVHGVSSLPRQPLDYLPKGVDRHLCLESAPYFAKLMRHSFHAFFSLRASQCRWKNVNGARFSAQRVAGNQLQLATSHYLVEKRVCEDRASGILLQHCKPRSIGCKEEKSGESVVVGVEHRPRHLRNHYGSQPSCYLSSVRAR